MTRTKIEWVRNPDGTQGYTRNPIKGYCPNNCSYCYAHRMYNRFGWDKTLRFDESVLTPIHTLKEPSRIFIGSMIDIYHSFIPAGWVREIIKFTRNYPEHTFITLTKFPENLYHFDFPENWWVGVTVDHYVNESKIGGLLSCTTSHNKIFVSLEPLLTPINTILLRKMDWIIIGGLTPKPIHEKSWIDDIVRRADDLHIPVFIKSNAHYPEIREEFPE